MSDEIIPVATGEFPAVPRTFSEAMPRLLLSLLERRYLADFQPSRWEISPAPADSARPLVREVRALGRPQGDEDRSRAMPHVLTAAHGQGHAIVTVVYGDGAKHRIFVGGRRLAGTSRGSTEDFLDGQAGLLSAHVPGLDLGPTTPLTGTAMPALSAFLHAAPALALVTGIPAPRGSQATAAFQNVDRLISAAGNRRYALIIVAEPLGTAELDEAIDECRRLKSEVHVLTRRNIQESEQEGTATSRQEGGGRPESDLNHYLRSLAVIANVAAPYLPGSASIQQPVMTALNLMAMWSGEPAPGAQVTTSESRTRGWSADLLNANAEACEQQLQRHIDRLQAARSSGWWRNTIYVAADGDGTLEAVTSALRAICSGEATALDPMRVLRIAPSTVRPAMMRGQSLTLKPVSHENGHPLGPSFDALATCVTSDELAVLLALPVRDVPGLPMRDVGAFALAAPQPVTGGVPLGTLRDSLGRDLQPVTVTAEALNRHVFITGMTGYGKTTTAKNLLAEAYQNLGIPFLVIEPAKAEYRELASHPALRGRLGVYSIGPDGRLPLRLNPFVPVRSVPLSRHIDLLKAVFNASFPMFAGMSYVLEEAMLEVYAERGWNLYTSANDVLGPHPSAEDLNALVPSIGDLYNKIEKVLEGKQYGREVHQNLGAALRSRLQSLVVGTKGMALDTRRSVPDIELFTQPCVIELRNLGDDEEKSFVMALLLCKLYEYAESRQAGRHQLQHLTLIEEAHRLLTATRPASSGETADAQAKAVGMFTDMLAEMRAYGEGFLVADQIPTKLAPEIIKNSNLKIVHRLVSIDDRAVVAGAINLTEAQARHLANLAPGDAVLHDEQIGSAVLVRMPPGTPAGSAPAAGPQDRSYLHRNGGCRHCPDPCSFLHLTPAGTADTELAPFFRALLIASPERAWETWSQSRSRWQDPGSAYCASSQAAFRWLGRLTDTGAALADSVLRQDRAARLIARLCASWSASTEWNESKRATAANVQSELARTIGAAPPRELPGCERCPARCRILPATGPVPQAAAAQIAASATREGTLAARLRELTKIAESTSPAFAQLPEHRTELLYCMVATSIAAVPTATRLEERLAGAQRGGELLAAIRENRDSTTSP